MVKELKCEGVKRAVEIFKNMTLLGRLIGSLNYYCGDCLAVFVM